MQTFCEANGIIKKGKTTYRMGENLANCTSDDGFT